MFKDHLQLNERRWSLLYFQQNFYCSTIRAHEIDEAKEFCIKSRRHTSLGSCVFIKNKFAIATHVLWSQHCKGIYIVGRSFFKCLSSGLCVQMLVSACVCVDYSYASLYLKCIKQLQRILRVIPATDNYSTNCQPASQPSQPIDNSYTIISTFLIEHKNHDHIKRQELDDPLKSFHVQYHHNIMRIVKF